MTKAPPAVATAATSEGRWTGSPSAARSEWACVAAPSVPTRRTAKPCSACEAATIQAAPCAWRPASADTPPSARAASSARTETGTSAPVPPSSL